ncbi:MAG: hypothetical protein JSV84_05130 [Gemmatimonadota bacterium]|nr:MAG: hypothetical protein JSV84_05130 [Gemmatimonadota bacterium]
MVVPTDVQVAFVVGAFFADIGAKLIDAAEGHSVEYLRALYARFRFRALAYPSVFVAPAATTFMLAWPVWETQYWSAGFEATGGNILSAGSFGIFLLLMFGAGWFGNWLGFRWVLCGARKRLRILYVSIVVLTSGLVMVHNGQPPSGWGATRRFRVIQGLCRTFGRIGTFLSAFAP